MKYLTVMEELEDLEVVRNASLERLPAGLRWSVEADGLRWRRRAVDCEFAMEAAGLRWRRRVVLWWSDKVSQVASATLAQQLPRALGSAQQNATSGKEVVETAEAGRRWSLVNWTCRKLDPRSYTMDTATGQAFWEARVLALAVALGAFCINSPYIVIVIFWGDLAAVVRGLRIRGALETPTSYFVGRLVLISGFIDYRYRVVLLCNLSRVVSQKAVFLRKIRPLV
nr:hypothetical protein Iba_chr08aCG11000 [Ipomoea batatas]